MSSVLLKGLVLHVAIALTWALLSGEVSLRELVIGSLLGYGILAVFARTLGTLRYVQAWAGLLGFAGFFVRELLLANVQVALLALRPRPTLRPLIVAVPLKLSGDAALTILAATITLLPGTVAMGFNAQRSVMYAHAVGTPNAAAARASILKVEGLLLRVLGREVALSRGPNKQGGEA